MITPWTARILGRLAALRQTGKIDQARYERWARFAIGEGYGR